jgi:hypothetical protein
MDGNETPGPGGRKPYTPPEVTRVTLRPEEAVLGACKNNATSGPGQPTCRFPSACSSQGS